MIRFYYAKLVGSIDDENMITIEEKSRFEKEIGMLKRDREKTNELITELIKEIADLRVSLKNELIGRNLPMEIVQEYSADPRCRSSL